MRKSRTKDGFSEMHPAVSFCYFMIVMMATLVFKHPLYIYTIFLVAILLNWTIDGGQSLNKSIKGYVALMLIVTVANPILSNRGSTILFYLFERPVTLEAIVYGIQFSFSLLTILILFIAYNLVVTYDKFLYLFAPIAPRTAFVIIVTLRFIPLLKKRLKDIMAIQKVQTSYAESKKIKYRIKNGMTVLHTLITWSLEDALITASSMRARGYGSGKRSSAIRYEWSYGDILVSTIMGALSIVLLIGAFLGEGQYEVYPELVAISLTPGLLLHYSSFLILILIPIIINGKVWLKWQFIKSKM